MFKKSIGILSLFLILLTVPMLASAEEFDLVDDMKDFSKVSSKSENWESTPDNPTGNRFTPHPELGVNVFGKKKAVTEYLVYNLKDMTSYEMYFYCVNQNGEDLIKPSHAYPPDNPTIFGVKIYISEDGQDWTRVEFKETKGEKQGESSTNKRITWYKWTVTPTAPLVSKPDYIKIEHCADSTWSMFVGGVKLSAKEVAEEPSSNVDTSTDTESPSSQDGGASSGGTSSSPASAADSNGGDKAGDNTLLYIIIAVMGVVIVGAGVGFVVLLKKKK